MNSSFMSLGADGIQGNPGRMGTQGEQGAPGNVGPRGMFWIKLNKYKNLLIFSYNNFISNVKDLREKLEIALAIVDKLCIKLTHCTIAVLKAIKRDHEQYIIEIVL